MQMMNHTVDGADRKRSTKGSITFHCVGKVNIGILTSKKVGLFFWGKGSRIKNNFNFDKASIRHTK